MKILALLVVSFISFSAIHSSVAQTTVSFDGRDLAEGDLVTNEFDGISLEGAILALPGSPQSAFTCCDGVQDTALGKEFTGPFITDEIVNGSTFEAGTISIFFEENANDVSFFIVDIETLFDGSDETATITGFGASDELLGIETIENGAPGTGDGMATRFDAPWENLRRMDVLVSSPNGNSGWGIDTLSYSSKTNLGDVNCDGQVDLLDVAPFVEALTIGEFNSKADINQDGSVDLLDVAPFVELLTGN